MSQPDKNRQLGEGPAPREGRENSRETDFDLASLASRFRVLPALVLAGILQSCDAPAPVPEPNPGVDSGEVDKPFIYIQDPRSTQEILLALKARHPVLNTNQQFLLFALDTHIRTLLEQKKDLIHGDKRKKGDPKDDFIGLEQYKEELKKLAKKAKPKKGKARTDYEKKFADLSKAIAGRESAIRKIDEFLDPENLGKIEAAQGDADYGIFLEKVTYSELKEMGLISPGDGLEKHSYLKVEGMWPLKLKAIEAAKFKGKERHLQACKDVVAKLATREVEKMTYEEFYDRIREVVRELKPHAGELGLATPYLDYLDADTLTSIVLHELMPANYNPVARIHIMSMMLDQGFEPEYVPAIHDTSASYGPYQATLPTQENIQSLAQKRGLAEIPNLDPKLKEVPNFVDATDLESQTLFAYLLTLSNHQSVYETILKKDPEFKPYFDRSTQAERRIFFSGLAGYFHNHGFTDVPAIEGFFTDEGNPVFSTKTPEATLQEAYKRFVENSSKIQGNKKEIAARHARGTGALVENVVAYGRVDHPLVLPSEHGASPRAIMAETSQLVKEIQGKETYVLHVTALGVEAMLTSLLQDPAKKEEILKFNNVQANAQAGTLIYVPIEDLKPELQDKEAYRIDVETHEDAATLVQFIVKPEFQTAWSNAALLALSNPGTWGEWSDIEGSIRVPKTWVDEARLAQLPRAKPEQVAQAPKLKRVPIPTDYDGMRIRGIRDGFAIPDSATAIELYEAAAPHCEEIKNSEHFIINLSPDQDPKQMKVAEEVQPLLEQLGDSFKEKSGGVKFVINAALRSFARQMELGSIRDGLHVTGRAVDIADGRFMDEKGRMLTWSVMGAGGKPEKGPDAPRVEELRAILRETLEEAQGLGYLLAFDETEVGAKARDHDKSRGHFHLYFPKFLEESGDEL